MPEQAKATHKKRGRPELPPEKRQDPQAKRSFYQPLGDYKFFFEFCDGDLSRDMPKLQALWMAVSGETRTAVSKIVTKGKSLQEATEELRKALRDILLDEVLAAQIAELPRGEKMAILSGQPVSLPATEQVKRRRGTRG